MAKRGIKNNKYKMAEEKQIVMTTTRLRRRRTDGKDKDKWGRLE
jgi:hypothetical protein